MIPTDTKTTYVTVIQEGLSEFEEKKSKFFGFCAHVETENEAVAFVNKQKKTFADASHWVYAYSVQGGMYCRYSDDGEPQGTAGMPILDCVKKSNVQDVCIVVVRYFGGTLLGTGGLVRAYSAAAQEALQKAKVTVYESFCECSLVCRYSEYQKILPCMAKYRIIIDSTIFDKDVTLHLAVKGMWFTDFEKQVIEITNGRIQIQKKGFRFDFLK